ncbi:hypothetical protein A4A49_06420 [Nicotiana attenuata]|uniref:Uncharacterized protein n=1 Tax=Nicotiana attenuata TaxID=49451 RepID=A0A1J6IPJ1_NICAT|nr:hypothetical protein A4A49_06420 [Nicotiana attenuata]
MPDVVNQPELVRDYGSEVRNEANPVETIGPRVSQLVLVSPFPAPSHFSYGFESADETGNSKGDHVFDELPEKYENIDSLALITRSNSIIQPIEDMKAPQVRHAKSIEVADMVQEPSAIIEEQVFDEISHTTLAKLSNDSFCENVSLQTTVPTEVLDDTRGSNTKEEENSRHNVALFKNSPQRIYQLLGESTENSLMRHFDGAAHIVEQSNALVLQSAICAYMNCNILAFSFESVTLLDQITRSRTISLRALLHSIPVVKSEEEDSGKFIGKKITISLQGILEYYGIAIVKDLTLVQITSFMALLVGMYTNLEAMAHAQTVCYDLPRRNSIRLKFLIFDFDPKSQEEDATRLFHQLMIVGVFLTNSIIDARVSGCSLLFGSKLERLLYGYSINTQITYNVRIGNIICGIPLKSGIPDCLDEASKRAAGIRNMPATVYDIFFYLKLGECSCIFSLQLVINLQMSCSRKDNKSTCLDVVLQELKIKALALTLQYGGNFSNSRDSKIYWKLIWLLILGRLTDPKEPYFMNPLPHASILRKQFIRVDHNYKVLLRYSWLPHLGLIVNMQHDAHKLFISILSKIHTKEHRALQCNIFLELRDKELLQHVEMGNLWIQGITCWSGLTLWLDVHNLRTRFFLRTGVLL